MRQVLAQLRTTHTRGTRKLLAGDGGDADFIETREHSVVHRQSGNGRLRNASSRSPRIPWLSSVVCARASRSAHLDSVRVRRNSRMHKVTEC